MSKKHFTTKRSATLLVVTFLITFLLSFPNLTLYSKTTPPIWPMSGFNSQHSGYCPYNTDNNNGILRWKYEIPDGGFLTSPIIGADETIYVGSTGGYLYAINPDGTLEWKYVIDVPIYDIAISLNNIIYVYSANGLYGVDTNGKLKWKYLDILSYPSYNLPMPCLTITPSGNILVASRDGYLLSITPFGTLDWKYKIFNYFSVPTIASVYQNSMFLYRNLNTSSNDNTLHLSKIEKTTPNNLNTDLISKIKSIWDFRLDDGYTSIKNTLAPCIGESGVIYVGSKKLYAIKPDGNLLWKFNIKNETFNSLPVISNDIVYICSNKQPIIYAINNKNGKLLWKYSTYGTIDSFPSISSNGTIFVGCSDWNLYAINPDGTLKWKFNTNSPIHTSPVIDTNGVIYITSGNTLYAIGKSCKNSVIIINLRIGNKVMTINGVSKELDPGRDTKPVIIPKWGRTVIPIRAIVEALGGTISWDPIQRMVTINLEDNRINLWIGKSQAVVNNVMKWIDPKNHNVKPIIVNGRTMLPLRFVAENIGCKVQWNPYNKTIKLIYFKGGG